MSEPTTPLKALIVPNTGDLVGTWGSAALNPDFSAIDGMLGGFTTISLSNANVTCSAPSGTITPGAGPTQSQNALIRLTGTLTANVALTIPLPGFYIVENLCTVNTFYVQLTNGGGGDVVAAPPGKQQHVFSDGTNVRFVNMPDVGSYLDLAASTTPPWYAGCTVKPWLPCDGSVYNFSNYTALATQLGSTFGGNGITTFGVPNLINKVRVPLSPSGGSALLTSAVSGIDGTVWGASGGDQRMQQHTHSTIFSDPGHTHPTSGSGSSTGTGGGAAVSYGTANSSAQNTGASTTGITVSNATTGAGSSQNVQPTFVHGITLVKT